MGRKGPCKCCSPWVEGGLKLPDAYGNAWMGWGGTRKGQWHRTCCSTTWVQASVKKDRPTWQHNEEHARGPQASVHRAIARWVTDEKQPLESKVVTQGMKRRNCSQGAEGLSSILREKGRTYFVLPPSFSHSLLSNFPPSLSLFCVFPPFLPSLPLSFSPFPPFLTQVFPFSSFWKMVFLHTQATPKLVILLPQVLQSWDYRPAAPGPSKLLLSNVNIVDTLCTKLNVDRLN